MSKTTTLHVHHAFWYISWPSVQDYDVKIPNSLEHKATSGSLNLEKVLIFSSRLEKSLNSVKVLEK